MPHCSWMHVVIMGLQFYLFLFQPQEARFCLCAVHCVVCNVNTPWSLQFTQLSIAKKFLNFWFHFAAILLPAEANRPLHAYSNVIIDSPVSLISPLWTCLTISTELCQWHQTHAINTKTLSRMRNRKRVLQHSMECTQAIDLLASAGRNMVQVKLAVLLCFQGSSFLLSFWSQVSENQVMITDARISESGCGYPLLLSTVCIHVLLLHCDIHTTLSQADALFFKVSFTRKTLSDLMHSFRCIWLVRSHVTRKIHYNKLLAKQPGE